MQLFAGEREKQGQLLFSLLDKDIKHNLICIHGPPSSGKSYILNQVIQTKNINNVYIQCNCVRNIRHLFDNILNGIYGLFHQRNSSNEPPNWRNHSKYKLCRSAAEFLHILQIEDFANKQSFYITFDNFQKLYTTLKDNNIIASLIAMTQNELSLRSIDNRKIGIILVDNSSCMIYMNQRLCNKESCLISIHFPAYTTKQIQSVLFKNTRKLFEQLNMQDKDIETTIGLLVRTFVAHTRNIMDYFKYLKVLIPQFVELPNQDRSNAISKLIFSYSIKIYGNDECDEEKQSFQSQFKKPNLCYISLLTLLSCYIASFNTQKFNKFAFTTNKQRRKRKRKKNDEGHKLDLKETGPEKFTISDISGIFIHLFTNESPSLGNRDLKQFDLRPNIAELISYHYISNVSVDGTLDDNKFKCNLDHEHARYIAKHIGIREWSDYLQQT